MPDLNWAAKEINEQIHCMIDACTLEDNDEEGYELAESLDMLHEGPGHR